MTVVLDPTALGAIPLFEGLGTEHLSKLKDSLRARHFYTGVQIVTAGERDASAYILTAGTVKVYMEREDGTSVTVAILGAGEIVGDMSLVDGIVHCASVLTLEDTGTLAMDEKTFRESLRTTPIMARNLANILSRRLRLANEQILALGTLDVRGRVARQIMVLANEYGTSTNEGIVIPIRLTQEDLADLVGASRVRVNQAFVLLKRSGIVSVDSRFRITVHKPDALTRRCP